MQEEKEKERVKKRWGEVGGREGNRNWEGERLIQGRRPRDSCHHVGAMPRLCPSWVTLVIHPITWPDIRPTQFDLTRDPASPLPPAAAPSTVQSRIVLISTRVKLLRLMSEGNYFSYQYW